MLLTLNTLTGADNLVAMNVATNKQETFTADFDAVVDSVISHAPGFVAAGYTITPSDGVGIYVPEPGDGLLTSAAVGALLCLGRRKPPAARSGFADR